jgi:hypothetical protein
METLILKSNNINHNSDREPPSPATDGEARHKLWREMHAAYHAYVSSSDALEASTCPPGFDDRPFATDQDSQIAILSATQRTAFEKYIDARLQYSEFECDQHSVAMGEGAAMFGNHPLEQRRSGSSPFVRVLPLATTFTLIAAIVCGAMYQANEQRRIHDLTLERDRVRITLAQMEGDLNAVTRRLDTTQPGGATQSSLSSANTRPVQHNGTKPSDQGSADTAPASTRANTRSYYDFRLPLSNQFRQVGQVRLSIRGIDRKRKSLDVWMKTGSRTERRQVRLQVPVAISQANGKPAISVIATRIEGNYVDGYVIQPIFKRVQTTAVVKELPAARERIDNPRLFRSGPSSTAPSAN